MVSGHTGLYLHQSMENVTKVGLHVCSKVRSLWLSLQLGVHSSVHRKAYCLVGFKGLPIAICNDAFFSGDVCRCRNALNSAAQMLHAL